jgi:hypothetical protein
MAKLTPAKIKEQIKKIQEEIEKAKTRYPGRSFTEVTPEEVRRKLKRAKSPIITYQFWTSSAPQGGTIDFVVGIHNPDPTEARRLFAHVWVGSGAPDPVTSTFLLNVDTRFPRLTQPDFPGAKIPSSSTLELNFALDVPSGQVVQESNYFGHTYLMKAQWFDPSDFLDRGLWVFTVT